jgi:hypothetical protein
MQTSTNNDIIELFLNRGIKYRNLNRTRRYIERSKGVIDSKLLT